MYLNLFVLLLLLFQNSFGFKINHQISRQTKSIFSNKKCTESFTPARFKVGMKSIMFDQPPSGKIMSEQYFPDVEYPTNIMEATKPFFYRTGQSNAMLGSFPDDVKSSYKTLIDKNKKSLEEMKVQYMNKEINARNCVKQNTDPTPGEQTVIEEALATLKQNDDDVFVDKIGEAISDEVSQNIVVPLVEDDSEEMELNDSTSESVETIDENEELTEANEQELQSIEENKEEAAVGDNLQSWESKQYYSDEILKQLSEGEDLDPQSENQLVSEEILEETDDSSTLSSTNVEESSLSLKEVSEVVEPDNTEGEPCLFLDPDNKDNSTFDKTKLLNIRLREKMRKSSLSTQNKNSFIFKRKRCNKL